MKGRWLGLTSTNSHWGSQYIYIYIYIYIQSWPKISAPLVNMFKEGCENESALLILLIFCLKNSQKSNLSLNNKNLKWEEISLWNTIFFSNKHWPQLTAPFYSILFETSICQLILNAGAEGVLDQWQGELGN